MKCAFPELDVHNMTKTQALTALNALLMHEITGNSIDRLKTVKSGLDAYLSGRREKGEAP